MRGRGYLFLSALFLVMVIVGAVLINLYTNGLNQYVVKVNGQEVKLDEFKIYTKIVKKEIEKKAGISKPEDIKKMWSEPVEGVNPGERAIQNALDMAVGIKIFEQKAKEMGIQLSQQEIDLVKEKLKRDGTVKEFNIKENELEVFARGMAISNKISNFIAKDINITDEELNDFLTNKAKIDMSMKYKTRHILFLTSDAEGKDLSKEQQDKALQLAKQVMERVKTGEDFSKLAQEYSQDPGSSSKGGGYEFYKGESVKEFEDAVMKLKVGKMSGIVKTVYGYHIIILDSIDKPTEADLDKSKKKYKDMLLENKRDQVFEEYFKKWNQEAKKEKNNKLLESININEI